MINANHIVNQQIALMQMRQAVLLCYLEILMSMRRVWETRPTTVNTSGRNSNTSGMRRTCAYDSKGNMLTRTSPDNKTINYSYNLNNKLIQKTYSDGTFAVFEYDNAGNMTYAGNSNIAYNMTYDADNRNAQITDSSARNIQYQYDAAGNRTALITPDGRTIIYSYDFNNLLTGITTNLGAFTFGYDADNRRITRTLPNGTTVAYSYDAGSRLLGIQTTKGAATIDSVTYTLDNVGNRLTKSQPAVSNAYNYDEIYRLKQATPTGGTMPPEAYTYDEVGNRLTKVPDTSPNTNETVVYGYDDENRLTSVLITAGNKTKQLSFAYDPFGRRISKTLIKDEIGTDCTTPNVCPRTTNYVYDGQNIILEYQNGSITARYTHGPNIDEPLALEKNGQTYYYHADGLGSITGLSDTTGSIVQTYSYDSFGNMNQTGTITQPYTYTAREYDTETGMYFYRARYYDAKVGRFVTKDPIGFAGGINQYSYVKNNPLNYNDPSGEIQACKRRFDVLAGPILPMRHCYIVLDSGDTLGFDNRGVHSDPLPGTLTKQCYDVDPGEDNCSKDKQCNDACLKKAMSGCSGWNLITNNCCDCVRNALAHCNCKAPPVATKPWNMY